VERRTIIIAEAGVNHNGNLEMAKELIIAAADANADYVKFQTFNSNLVVTGSADKADYQIKNTGVKESQLEMISKLELSQQDHYELKACANQYGIKLFSTAFDLPSIDFLRELDFDLFKIPSGEITNLPYLRHAAGFGKPIILSTGMSSLGEIEDALKVLEGSGMGRKHITLLHCTSEYPAPLIDVNLKAIKTLEQAFGLNVGYSDHTEGIEVSIAAVALGATIIEKHFTLDKKLPGPDHKASVEPEELKSLVNAIRNVNMALGDGRKRVTTSELENIKVARKSLVAATSIKKGERFTTENISVKRPGVGISPMRYEEIMGRLAPRDFYKDDLIEI
jgi:N,N'-diacetyllegionaminate synthase